jgi:pimeloyl-ACP methyl ester carboxylesterase
MGALRAATLVACLLCVGSARAEGGFTRELSVPSAAFVRADAPSVLVHAPGHLDRAAPLRLVVFLHGYSGCARVLMGAGPTRCREGDRRLRGWDLAGIHDAAGTNTLLLVPQLEWMKRSGKPGCFGKQGCFRRFLGETLAALSRELGGARTLDDVASITLLAHSAGFQTAAAILQHGDVGELVHHVVLYDALYARAPVFARWIAQSPVTGAKLISIHLGRGKTYQHSRTLHRIARRRLGAEHVARVKSDGLLAAVRDPRRRVIVASGRGAHRDVPVRYTAELLRALLGRSDASGL